MEIEKLKIEKGIPIPEKTETSMTALLKTMEVGDSILLPSHPKNVYQLGIQIGFKFTARKTQGGVRLWRTK